MSGGDECKLHTLVSLTIGSQARLISLKDVTREGSVSTRCLRRMFSTLHGTRVMGDVGNSRKKCFLRESPGRVAITRVMRTLRKACSLRSRISQGDIKHKSRRTVRRLVVSQVGSYIRRVLRSIALGSLISTCRKCRSSIRKVCCVW